MIGGQLNRYIIPHIFPRQKHMKHKDKSGILNQSLALDLNYGNCWY